MATQTFPVKPVLERNLGHDDAALPQRVVKLLALGVMARQTSPSHGSP